MAADAKTAWRRTKLGSGFAAAVATTNAGSDRVKTGNEAKKKRAAIFLGCSYFSLRVVCGTEGGTTDWNSPAQQRERPKGDRLFAFHCFLFYLIGCNLSIAVFSAFNPVCLYFSVVSGLLCPAKYCTTRKSLFLINKLAITLCLIVVLVNLFLDCF